MLGIFYVFGCFGKDYVKEFNFRVKITKDKNNVKVILKQCYFCCSFMALFVQSYYCLLQHQRAEEERTFDKEIKLCLKHRISYVLWFHFGLIFNAYSISCPFLMKICVKDLRHDSYKIALHILTKTIDEVIIGSIIAQASTDFYNFFEVFLSLRKFPPLK